MATADDTLEAASWLRRIANDLRASGDVPLLRLSEDGVAQTVGTLADELWLVALLLDSEAGCSPP